MTTTERMNTLLNAVAGLGGTDILVSVGRGATTYDQKGTRLENLAPEAQFTAAELQQWKGGPLIGDLVHDTGTRRFATADMTKIVGRPSVAFRLVGASNG